VVSSGQCWFKTLSMCVCVQWSAVVSVGSRHCLCVSVFSGQQWSVLVQDIVSMSVCVQWSAMVSIGSRHCLYVCLCSVVSNGQYWFKTMSVCVSGQQWSVLIQDIVSVCVCVQWSAVVSISSRQRRCSVWGYSTKTLSDIISMEQSCVFISRSTVDLLWPVCQPTLL